ncbi:hypothetical protein F183_A43760 [Bryobacterales bacterium F-183]|nr:hypothetical protein F183_A43760 [Bryobacterales bacterium F-183]
MAAETLFGSAGPIPAHATERRREREKGVVLLLGTLSIPVLVSMMGMGIDASIMYSVKNRIQLASDGASLAAARALSVGLTTEAQADSARTNANNWFNRNFPPGTFGVSNITVDNPQVYDDPEQPLVRHVVVTAAANAPSYFMRYWGYDSTRILASSRATRRDSVIMMVLDRSGSMANSNSCTPMKNAAKQFTGMFSAQRDRIGMITFNMAANIASAPSLNFKTTLGYSDASNSGSGLIDTIQCTGGTGTPAATILGYNELYKIGLPGALNVLLLFTDGNPTATAFDYRVGPANPNGILGDNSNCQDALGRSVSASASPRGNLSSNPPNWTPGWDLGAGSFLANVPAGPVAMVYSDDNNSGWSYNYRTLSNTSGDSTLSMPGCSTGLGSGNAAFGGSRVNTLPDTDVFGNSLELPELNTLTYNAGRISGTRQNLALALQNASANAANRARTTRTLPDGRDFPGVFVYTIGLGNVNHGLMQRMANDPSPEANGLYPAFTGYNSAQPQGTYVYAEDNTRLSQAFAQIASFILRLSQ